MNFSHYKIIFSIFLVIVLIVLFYVNKDALFSLQEPAYFDAKAAGPQPDERQAYNDNKADTGKINTLTYNEKLTNITTQINECKALITELNSVLPNKVQNIRIGNVVQTDDLDDVKVTINSETITEVDPKTGNNEPTGVWTMDFVLPRGQPGEQGIQGQKGKPGPPGDEGNVGEQGVQGLWGQECK